MSGADEFDDLVGGLGPGDGGDVASLVLDGATVVRLAKLDPLAYDRCREVEAKNLGARVSTLDAEVLAQRAAGRSTKFEQSGPVLSPLFSDDALALAFSKRHADRLLYVPAWRAWLRWDGVKWVKDDILTVFDKVRLLCRETASNEVSEKDGEGVAKDIASAGTIAAVERLARSDRRHARSADVFDADPWVLNTPSGVVDLRTGKIRPHKPADMLTKVAGATPVGECPRFLAFLHEITQQDAELTSFLQRFIGYTLTGSIREHAFLFTYGPGGNGKGVLFSILSATLGDYATTAMHDVFTATKYEQHSTNLAALRGARMVAVTEVEEGRSWAEAKVKAFTGGDKISARVMRGDPFEFSPEGKLWFSGNHKPPLRNPDTAMRRRMNLVPLTYVPDKPDPKLLDALMTELPGILAWAVEGCLDWQTKGLCPPAIVTQATDEYFAEQNAIAIWLTESCDELPCAETSSRQLFQSWKQWALARGDDPGSETRFSLELEKRFVKKKARRGMVFKGLALRQTDGQARDPSSNDPRLNDNPE